MTDRIGSAPVSYGVFGTADTGALEVTPRELLAQMAAAGYTGSEVGPPGFFGTPDQTAAAFAAEGLAILGAYMPLHLAGSDETMARDLDGMRQSLAELQAGGNPLAVAVLADEGDPELIRNPYRDPGERGLTPAQWDVAAERLEAARLEALAYGVAVSFHPHYGTYVEQAGEIDTLMERSSVGLCFDSGHFLMGGADPVTYARKYANRINHVHVKDLHLAVAQRARAEHNEDFEAWWENLCCPLGEGDVDVAGCVAALLEGGYAGWWVVEQDRGPVTRATWPAASADQLHNYDWMVAHLPAADAA
jgi:inosose dehydratase